VPLTAFKVKLPILNGPALLVSSLPAAPPAVGTLPLPVLLELVVLLPLVGLGAAVGLVLAPLFELETPVEELVDMVTVDEVPVAAVVEEMGLLITSGPDRFVGGSIL
jgi:hypothetical protein